MYKSFSLFICGFLICAVTMTVQAQVQEANSLYYCELQVDLQNGKYGLLFRNELVVPYEYDAIVAQKDNRGFISQQSDKYGIITVFIHYGDNTVKMRQFSQQRQYFFEEEGRGRKAKGVNLSVMDISCEYDEIKFTNGNYWVGKGDLKGVFNSVGGTILRCEFNEIEFTDGRYWVSKGNLKGVFNSAGGTILRCEFDKVELTSDNKYIAYKDGNKSWYNSAGGHLNTITDVVYSTD